MKRILAFIIFGSLISVNTLFGQQTSHLSIQYDMSFGMGNLSEYIGNPSFRGASAQYRYAVNDRLLVGMDLGWNVFYEAKDYDSYSSGTQTLSGKQYRYQNQVPILVAADFMILPDGDFQPYIGLGIGTMYSERATDMGTWRWLENPWHFALKPEVGFLYWLSYGTAFKLSGKYYTGFKSGDLETQSYFTVSAGLAFRF